MPTTSSSPDVENISVTVDDAPGGTPAGSPVEIGHLDTFDTLIDKSRTPKKYTPINNGAYSEIVALGSITQGPFSFNVLYDPEGAEGINILEAAIDANTEVQIIMELNNGTTSGTKITTLCKVSSFKVTGEKDGKFMASVTGEKLGTPTKTAAVSA